MAAVSEWVLEGGAALAGEVVVALRIHSGESAGGVGMLAERSAGVERGMEGGVVGVLHEVTWVSGGVCVVFVVYVG